MSLHSLKEKIFSNNVRFPDKYHKLNGKIKFKKMIILIGNISVDIPLYLPIEYKKEFNLESKYWKYGTDILLNL